MTSSDRPAGQTQGDTGNTSPKAVDDAAPMRRNGEQLFIFDTTLRDGEQCPGATMTHREKLQVAELLDSMGVDIIEAGFPIASTGDFEAVSEIAKIVQNATVAGLARANDKDIDRAGEAVRHARNSRIHTFISTSPVHMKYKLQMEPEAVLEMVTRSVTRARGFTDDVEWSAEDATRTEHDFLCRCCEAAIKAGATTVNIPDTVGYTVPEEYCALFEMLRERVPGADRVIWSTHCHNDLGMAVANSIAGVRGGARQIECTINGIGERAGNAALEEIAMAFNVRGDRLPYWHSIKASKIARASKLVASVTAFPVQYNKAIVGKNAFAHESGIHQDGMLKHTQTYEIMTPESVGDGHCHNDLGMAVANSIAGVRGGARQIECTINGIGERAGNAALEEIAMAFNVRGDRLPYWHSIKASKIARASKLVASVTAFPVQYNKAIVGKNAFAHESGIHQDGMLKHTQTYEIMTPESVGVKETSLVMGKHSGRAAFRSKLSDLGYELGDNQFQDAFKRFKDLADKKKHVFDEDIESLLDQGIADQKDHIRFVGLEVFAGNRQSLRAIITLEVDGKQITEEASGDGPVDSIFNAIKAICPHKASLQLFQVMAVTGGTDAQAEVLVRMEEGGKTYTGRGAETDTMVASAKAYVSALNKLLLKRGRVAPRDLLAS